MVEALPVDRLRASPRLVVHSAPILVVRPQGLTLPMAKAKGIHSSTTRAWHARSYSVSLYVSLVRATFGRAPPYVDSETGAPHDGEPVPRNGSVPRLVFAKGRYSLIRLMFYMGTFTP